MMTKDESLSALGVSRANIFGCRKRSTSLFFVEGIHYIDLYT